MTIFAEYSRYYDLLYRDKDYIAEVDFVTRLIRTHAPSASRILELGCGTGRHAGLLAAKGFTVHGVDCSEDMLADAELRRTELPEELGNRLEFSCGDIRELRIGKNFDVVISLFHVMSYMKSNDDLSRAFATARAHLGPGGMFLFDCWYGPAVLSDPPTVWVKRLLDDQVEITRIAEPNLLANENCVVVNYEVHVRDRATAKIDLIKESHCMRYLFLPEVGTLFAENGMNPVLSCEWLTRNDPGIATWNLCAGGVVKGI